MKVEHSNTIQAAKSHPSIQSHHPHVAFAIQPKPEVAIQSHGSATPVQSETRGQSVIHAAATQSESVQRYSHATLDPAHSEAHAQPHAVTATQSNVTSTVLSGAQLQVTAANGRIQSHITPATHVGVHSQTPVTAGTADTKTSIVSASHMEASTATKPDAKPAAVGPTQVETQIKPEVQLHPRKKIIAQMQANSRSSSPRPLPRLAPIQRKPTGTFVHVKVEQPAKPKTEWSHDRSGDISRQMSQELPVGETDRGTNNSTSKTIGKLQDKLLKSSRRKVRGDLVDL